MQKWQVGDVTITKIVEVEGPGGMEFLLPQATPDAVKDIEWLKPHFVTEEGVLIASVHALVVETPDRRIIVDTCIGNDKTGRSPEAWNNLQLPFLEDLKGAGFEPDSIDNVMCTHLHIDHVGWNTKLEGGQWMPTFPNARYLMAETEFAHWRTQEDDEVHRAVFADSVQPVFDADLVDFVEPTHKVCDEIELVPTHGHTPGHVSVLIESGGEQALITGDFMHHPCQIAHSEWSATVDYDPDAARETRKTIFERFADTPTLIIGTHFAGATAGHLKRDGETYRLDVA